MVLLSRHIASLVALERVDPPTRKSVFPHPDGEHSFRPLIVLASYLTLPLTPCADPKSLTPVQDARQGPADLRISRCGQAVVGVYDLEVEELGGERVL